MRRSNIVTGLAAAFGLTAITSRRYKMRSTLFVSVVALTAAFAPAAVAQSQMQGHGSMPGMMSQMEPAEMQKMMQTMMPAAADTASTKEFKQGQMSMMKNMHLPFTGDADVDFRTHMIPHHQGAIDMAKIAL